MQITSYVMNGAAVGYGADRYPAAKLGAMRGDAVIWWETDEKDPFNFYGGSSYPDEGVSQRHNIGALIGGISGSAEYIKFKRFYSNEYAGRRGDRGGTIPKSGLPNRIWCNPDKPNGLE